MASHVSTSHFIYFSNTYSLLLPNHLERVSSTKPKIPFLHSFHREIRSLIAFPPDMPHHGNPVYFKETSPFDWGVKGYVKFQLVHGERTPRQIQDGWPRSLRVITKCKNGCCSQDEIDQANVHYGRWKTTVCATLTLADVLSQLHRLLDPTTFPSPSLPLQQQTTS